MSASPARTALPWPQGGVSVGMSPNYCTEIGIDNGHGLHTDNLTYCIAVATFCSHGRHPTLTHVTAASEALGRTLADEGHVHTGDTIVIGLGHDAHPTLHANEYSRSCDLIARGLADRRVTRINFKMDYAGNRPELNAHSFVVRRNASNTGYEYGRAPRGVPAPRRSSSGSSVGSGRPGSSSSDSSWGTPANARMGAQQQRRH